MHFTNSYFNSGKIKDESMNTRSNLRAMGETIGVSPGNKKSVDTIDGQTLSSKVEEPISSVWDRFTTKKHVFTEGNQSHHPTGEARMRLYHGCEENDEVQTITHSTSTCEIPQHRAHAGLSIIMRSHW